MRPDGRAPGRGPTGPSWQPPPGAPDVEGSEPAIVGGVSVVPASGDSGGGAGGGDGSPVRPAAGSAAAISSSRALRRYGNYSSAAARRAVELASSPGGGLAAPQTAHVTFWLQYHAEWGQRLRVIGSHPKLGEDCVLKASRHL